MSQTLDVTNTETKWSPYPKYKASGVEWLGEIPEHWEVKRVKYVAQMNPDTLSEDTDANFELRYVDISNVDAYGTILNTEVLTFGKAPSRARRRVQDTDTIISTVRTYLKAIAFIDNQPENLIVSTGFAVLRPLIEVYPKFLWLLIQSKGFVDMVVVYSQGIGYPAINPSSLASLPLCLPPLPEQRAIAAFLDRETASINALIAKKQQLITLLRERRTALISHAVTKGLDPTVPMKDSGVAWLGEIPESWEVKRLKFVTPKGLVNGLFKKRDDFGSGTKLVNVADIYTNNFLINLASLDRVKADQQEIATYKVSPGDIFFVRSSLKAEGVGVSACVTEVTEATVFECHLVRLRLSSKQAVPKYMISYLNSSLSRQRLISLSQTTTMTTIGQDELASLEVALPPLSEQQAIVDYLDKEIAHIDALIARIEDGIKKLQEYSTALISAAVTGKIDVRNVTTKVEE